MFSSQKYDWETPQALFDALDRVFHFTLDVCATPVNAKCVKFFTPDDNSLKQEWHGICWMNPPYGREVSRWVKKASESAKQNGATVVCLLPARVDTKWWHEYCVKGEVYFIQGRLKFGKAKHSAPFPSAIVVFRPTVADAFDGHLCPPDSQPQYLVVEACHVLR